MKGRFFPSYEYRLFIRHRPFDPTNDITDADVHNNKKVRRDTVLMMAKTRTKNAGQVSGIVPPKKGSNNYYLHLPQQNDLDIHFNSVNGLKSIAKSSKNGPGSRINSSEFSGVLGRLQSNFVGTEFQIFTPRSKMKSKPLKLKSSAVPRSLVVAASSDEEMLHDSASNNELNSPSTARRRSRFRRLSLRGRSSYHDDPSEHLQSHLSPLTLRRSHSSGDSALGRKTRSSRRVSAADALESQFHHTQTEPTSFEEEDGAITYTANLLGSRPRIMDVCIPKINSDGVGVEWKRYLENCFDHDASTSADRLLNHLKELQQNDGIEGHPDDFGLLALQNRPPWWNVELGSFVLNFGGRVSVASVKNFQLCDRNDQDHIMLQFGRIDGRHSFTMDFQYPLTAVQAFAIAISSLQSKISFG